MHPLAWRDVALRPRIGDDDGLRWVARENYVSLGIPAPVRTLLQATSP